MAKEQLTKLLWQHQGGILGPTDIDYASTQYGMQWQTVITLNSVGGHQFAGELLASQAQAEESAAMQAIEALNQKIGAAQLASLSGSTTPSMPGGIGDTRKKGMEMFFPAGQGGSASEENNDGWGKSGEREELASSENLYIKGLPLTSTEDSIRQDFAAFGTVQSVKILESRPGNKCKAAMVHFTNEAEAKNVKDSFDGQQLDGFPQPLMVKYTAAPKWMNKGAKGDGGGKGWGKAKGEEVAPCDNLYVEGFPLPLTEDFVKAEFSALQVTVLSVKVLNPRESDTCGAAMVQLSSEFEATYVKDTLSGQHPNGFPQPLKVRFSERRKKWGDGKGDGKGDWGKAADGAGGKGGCGKGDGGFMDLLGFGGGNKIDGVMQLLTMMMGPDSDSNSNPMFDAGLSNTSSWDAGKGKNTSSWDAGKGNDFGWKGKGKGDGKDKGKGKGKSKKSPGHMLEKTRISEWKIKGTCTKWIGKYGFVQPAEPIEHAKATLRQGSLFVKQDDIQGDVTWLNEGQMCEFYVYEDASGLGAEEVVPF